VRSAVLIRRIGWPSQMLELQSTLARRSQTSLRSRLQRDAVERQVCKVYCVSSNGGRPSTHRAPLPRGGAEIEVDHTGWRHRLRPSFLPNWFGIAKSECSVSATGSPYTTSVAWSLMAKPLCTCLSASHWSRLDDYCPGFG